MSTAREIALADAQEFFAGRTPDIVVVDGDHVGMVAHEVRTDAAGEYDVYAFRVARVDGQVVAQTWTNEAHGSAPYGVGVVDPAAPPVVVGDGDPAATKPRVVDFYRCIFDAHNPAAVGDFYAADFVQHARTQPQTVADMERFVAAMFPDGPIPTPDEPALPADVLVGEGEIVIIGSGLRLPGPDGPYTRYLFDAFRVRGGMLVEHWSGQDPRNIPQHGDEADD